jgi:hypothetical protein
LNKIEHIIETVLPYTKQERNCKMKKAKLEWQRENLRALLQKHYSGEPVNLKKLFISSEQIEEITTLLK